MRLARAATASIGVFALALGSTASAAVRPSDSVVAPTESAAAVTAVDRLGSPVASSEDLRGRPVLVIILAALIVGGIIILISDSESP
jgi:hypothetical protein